MTDDEIAKWLRKQQARASKLDKFVSFYTTGAIVFIVVSIIGHISNADIIKGIGFIGFLAAASLVIFCGVLSMAILFYSIRKGTKLLKQNEQKTGQDTRP